MKYALALAALVLASALTAQAADEGKIAFSSDRANGGQIWAMNADGSNPVNLTNSIPIGEGFPAWSPDGSQLVYARTDEIWSMNADGSGQTRVVGGNAPTEPAFRSNNQISYSRRNGSDWDLFTAQLNGSNETPILSNKYGDYSGRWNADGSKIVFYTFIYQGSGGYPPYIYTANPDGSGQARITTAGGDRNPCWNPNGGRIVFQSYRDGNEEIYIMNADGTNQTRLTNNATSDTRPVFSPDGKKIVFVSNRDGNNEIYVMNADGTDQHNITNNSANDGFPSWQRSLPVGAPSVSIGDVTLNEGDSGTTNAVFPLTLSAASGTEVSVTYQTFDGTAMAGRDFIAAGPVTVTFAPGEITKSINIPVIGDKVGENTEQFSVRITAVGASIARQQGVATIVNTDGELIPLLSLGNATKVEGNTGSSIMEIPLTLTPASNKTVSVQYTTEDGTASAGSDYDATSSTLAIPAGKTSAVIRVSINGDYVVEGNETLWIRLSNPINAQLARTGTVSAIRDDDILPGLTIADVSVNEGNTATFTLTLTNPAINPVTVKYATINETALAGEDYTSKSGVATIPAGQTSVTVNVETQADEEIEANETFKLLLSQPTNAVLVTASATAQIINDDLPEIMVGDLAIREGKSGQFTLTATIWLSAPALLPVTVNVATADGTAKAGSDYQAKTGYAYFYPGQVSQFFFVNGIADTNYEANETFFLNLSGATNGVISVPQGKITLLNDDVQPSLRISDVTVEEGNTNKTINFTVSLSTPSWQTVTVRYATANSTAMAGSDYTAKSGALVFSAGETSKTISVVVNGDTVLEGDETFFVNLSNPTNTTIAAGQGTATLTNDDAAAARSAREN